MEGIEDSQIIKGYATLKSDFKREIQRTDKTSRVVGRRRAYINALKSGEEYLTKLLAEAD